MVKASLAGTIIGNILFVLGVAMVVGGTRHGDQSYDAHAARTQSHDADLAVLALILPAAYPGHRAARRGADELDQRADRRDHALRVPGERGLHLVRSGRDAAAGQAHAGHGDAHHGAQWSPGKALLVLCAVTVGIVWLSEIPVGTVEAASEAMGFSDAFTGVFVLAVIGGAAEQATAIVAARQNRMDLSMSITWAPACSWPCWWRRCWCC